MTSIAQTKELGTEVPKEEAEPVKLQANKE